MSRQTSDLSPLEIAAIHNHIDTHLNQGVYTSMTEVKADIRHPGYHLRGPLGELFRHAIDMKEARTTASGVSLASDSNRVVDIHGDHSAAVAFKDADGNI